MSSNSQGHPDSSAGGQGEAEADAEAPASLLLRPATGAGGGAPLDEEGGAPRRHQRDGENHKHARFASSVKPSEVESLMSTCLMSLSQECVYCEDAAAAPLEEDLHDMDMGPLGEEMSQDNQNKPSQSEMSEPQQDADS